MVSNDKRGGGIVVNTDKRSSSVVVNTDKGVKTEWLKANDYIYLIHCALVSHTQVIVHLEKETYYMRQG